GPDRVRDGGGALGDPVREDPAGLDHARCDPVDGSGLSRRDLPAPAAGSARGVLPAARPNPPGLGPAKQCAGHAVRAALPPAVGTGPRRRREPPRHLRHPVPRRHAKLSLGDPAHAPGPGDRQRREDAAARGRPPLRSAAPDQVSSADRSADALEGRGMRRHSMRSRPSFLVRAALLLLLLGPAASSAAQEKSPAPKAKGDKHALPLPSATFTGDFDGMKKRRLVRVLVVYNKTNYFIDRGTPRGITTEAFKMFEDYINQKYKTGNLRIHVAMIPTRRDALAESLLGGKGDI